MKDSINREAIDRIARAFSASWPAFDTAAFKRNLCKQTEPLELKARVQLVSERLPQRLPQRFSELADILHELPHH